MKEIHLFDLDNKEIKIETSKIKKIYPYKSGSEIELENGEKIKVYEVPSRVMRLLTYLHLE